jgi:hypothetical protein
VLLVSSSRFATGGPLGSRSLSRGSIVPNRPLMGPEAAPPLSPSRVSRRGFRFGCWQRLSSSAAKRAVGLHHARWFVIAEPATRTSYSTSSTAIISLLGPLGCSHPSQGQ